MQFANGAKVFTADGERVGTIDRVVLDPDTREVTHLVVKKGLLFKEDKVVPISLVGPATEDKVTLRGDAGDWEKLPGFEEAHYVPVRPARPRLGHEPAPDATRWARPILWYPPVGTWWVTGAYADYGRPRYVAKTKKNIPEGTVALEEGAKVMSSDGEQVGNIERVITDPLEDRATHLLVSEGLILKEKKLIPTAWMSSVVEDGVRLSVDSDLVESLPEYELQD
jgi:uncharacterized protein YrrD